MSEIPKTQNPDAVAAAASASGKSAASTSADSYLASFTPPPQPDRSNAGEAKHAEMSSAKAPTSFPGDTEKIADTGKIADANKAADIGKTAATGGKAPIPASFDQRPVSSQAPPPAEHKADHAAEMSSAKAPTSFPGDTDKPMSDVDKYLNSPEQRSAQAGGSAIVDALGVIPVVGSYVAFASTVYDLGHALTDIDHAPDHVKEAVLDTMGIVPIVGQVLSAEALAWDAAAAQARQNGVSDADAPTFSQAWVKGVDGYLSDIMNPESFNPQPPKQTGQ